MTYLCLLYVFSLLLFCIISLFKSDGKESNMFLFEYSFFPEYQQKTNSMNNFSFVFIMTGDCRFNC